MADIYATTVEAIELPTASFLEDSGPLLGVTGGRVVQVPSGSAAKSYATRDATNMTLAASLPEGTTFKVAGLDYKVETGGTAASDLGVSNISPAGFMVTPEHFGAVPFGNGVSAEAINAARQYCATNGVVGGCIATKYDCDKTITTNGAVGWLWGDCELSWENVDWDTVDRAANFTEAMENPTGTTEPEGSGKYVLFDTVSMARSSETGRLRIKGSAPGGMKVAQRATIPSNVVAITCSSGSSAEISWGELEIIGCDEALWAGDQRGSGATILPYTGWTSKSLTVQFCNRCVRGGQSGNTFDDARWGAVRFKRNLDFGVLRSEFVCDTIFLNALQEINGDVEAPTVTFPRATSSDNSFTTSADLGLSVGDVIHVYRANLARDGTTDIPFVSRVTAYTHPNGTTESVPDQAVTTESVIVNPTTPLLLTTGELIGKLIFMEEAADGFIQVEQKGSVTGELKYSDGRLGCRYNTPIVMLARNGGSVSGKIHKSSENGPNAKALVGVSVMQNTTGDEEFSAANVHLLTSLRSSEYTDTYPVKAIELESDHLPTDWEDRFGDLHPGTYNATTTFSDGTVQHFLSGTPQDAYKTGPNGGFDVGANLRGAEDMTGVTVTGADTSLGGGQVTKVAGAAGTCFEAVTVATGDRLRVKVNVSALTASQIIVRAYDGSGTNISPQVLRIRSAGEFTGYFDAPSGMARIGIEFPDTSAAVVDSLVLQKVLSA